MTQQWPAPEPLGNQMDKAGPFPVQVLPPVMRDLVNTVATNKQVPRDMVALSALSTVAALVGPRLAISRGRSWTEALCLFTATAMVSGSRKSAALNAVIKPLWEIEQRAAKAHEEHVRAKATQLRGDLEVCRREASKAAVKDLEQQIEDLENSPPPRLLTSNSTPEALEMTMAANGGHISIMDSEGGTFAILAGRYTAGTPNLELALKSYDGDFFHSARVTRSAVSISRALLTLGLCVQPSVLITPKDKPALLEQGLMGRFLYAVPESLLGKRDSDAPDLDDHAVQAWRTEVLALADIPLPGEGESLPVLNLTEEARKLHVEFQRSVEKRLDPETGDLGYMTDWAGKHVGRVLRVAGLLHLAAGQEPRQLVEEDTMRSAIIIGEWAIPHAVTVYNGWSFHAGEGGDEQCLTVLRWVRREALKRPGQPLEFTRRDVCRGVRQTWITKDAAQLVLDQLVEMRWLAGAERPTGPGGGRPTLVYRPHPLVTKNSDSVPERWRL